MNDSSLAIREGGKAAVLSNSGEHYEISLYADAPATDEQIILCTERLRDNYPNQTAGFWAELQSQIEKVGMSGQQLADAVDNVLQNHHYATIRIADVVNFDKKRKLYSYQQMANLIAQHIGSSTDDFEIEEQPDGRKLWKARTGKFE